VFSTFQPASGHPLNYVPLGDDEDDQDRDTGYHTPDRDDCVIYGVGTLEDGETRWQGKATRGEEYVDRDVGTPGVVGYR
jgi:hypothetical protein